MLSVRTLLLVAHVAAAVVLIGPATSASSSFARHASRGDVGAMREAHRVTRAYGTAAVVVPGVGFALAARSGLFDQLWVQLSIVLVLAAGAVLIAGHVPAQRLALAAGEGGEPVAPAVLARLRATAGCFAAGWLAVVVLMVGKPS